MVDNFIKKGKNVMINKILYVVVTFVFIVSVGTLAMLGMHAESDLQDIKNKTSVTKEEDSHGVSPTIIAALISTVGSISLGLLLFYLNNRKPKKSVSLQTHPIFSAIEEVLTTDLKRVNLGTDGRNKLFKFMLQTQLETYSKLVEEFVDKKQTWASLTEFREDVRSLILSINQECDTIWVSGGVPKIAIFKFKEFNDPRINILLSDIDTIIFYKNYNSHDEALFVIFEFLSFVLRLGLSNDGIKALMVLNGDLTGIEFQGTII